MRGNMDQNNSENGYFSCSDYYHQKLTSQLLSPVLVFTYELSRALYEQDLRKAGLLSLLLLLLLLLLLFFKKRNRFTES